MKIKRIRKGLNYINISTILIFIRKQHFTLVTEVTQIK